MGIYWDWAFGNETTATLTSEVGFAFSTADALATSSDTYIYSGRPLLGMHSGTRRTAPTHPYSGQ